MKKEEPVSKCKTEIDRQTVKCLGMVKTHELPGNDWVAAEKDWVTGDAGSCNEVRVRILERRKKVMASIISPSVPMGPIQRQ